jgi:hypothetical protein
MRCITGNILHNLINYKKGHNIWFILIFIISLSIFHSSVFAQEEKTKERAVIIASCNALQHINKVANADKKSSKEATKIFRELATRGDCRRYYGPIMVDLGKLEYSYVDSNGIHTEVWKLLGQKLWVLIAKEKNSMLEV